MAVMILILTGTGLFQSVDRNILAIEILHWPAKILARPQMDQFSNDVRIERLRAYQFITQAQYQEAFLLLDQIPSTQRNSLDWMRLAISAAYLGHLQDALVYVDRAAIPTDTLVLWGRENWTILEGKDNPTMANLWFSAASQRSDGSFVSRRDLGLWWLWHDPNRAVVYLEPVWREMPDDAWSNYLLARAYWNTGKQDQAINRMEQANKSLRYSSASYCIELTQMYLARGLPDDLSYARSILQLCLEQQPTNETLRLMLVDLTQP
jgi:tetratricopeptide (TPR) repeat protein